MTTYGRPGVYITERLLPAPIASAGTADAAGAVIGNFAQGPTTVTLVTSWYDFVKKFGGYNISFPATFGVGQYFQNGGSELFVKRVVSEDAEAAAVVIASTGSGNPAVGTVTAKNAGSYGNNLRVLITASAVADTFDFAVYLEGRPGTASSITDDVLLEQYQNVVFDDPASGDYAPSVINFLSEHITVEVTDGLQTPVSTVLPLTGGTEGEEALVAADYTGAVEEFSAITRPLVVFAPGLVEELGSTAAITVYNSLISWAEDNAGFVIVDTAANLAPSAAITAASALTASSSAAMYYPHLYIADPVGRSPQALRKISPAGAVAGLYMATDKLYGPFKAPAGIRATLRGAVALERAFTSTELDSLNSGSRPVNALRNLPGAGVVAMGARTQLQDGTANKYVNMRRSLNYIRKQLELLTEFALFENNDERLWAIIRTNIAVFLGEYRNQGGLRGETEEQAFFIKVDAENNPQATIAQGQVHIEVGVALQSAAEFVVINLSQKTAV
jgi:hypothetical protein